MHEKSVQLTLHGHLWRVHPDGIRSREAPWNTETSVKDLLGQLGIPENQVMVVIVNGVRRRLDYHPQDKDHVEVFPVIDGG